MNKEELRKQIEQSLKRCPDILTPIKVYMISEYQRFGESSGLILKCDKKCIVLDSYNWNVNLSTTKDSIVFIDEGNSFVKSKEFAAAIKGTDNYYAIVTRENLFELPISVEAIYGIKGRKYFQLKRTYNSLYRIYPRY